MLVMKSASSQEKQLPVFERLGDVQSLVVCRTEIALMFLRRRHREDATTAIEHLLWSLQTARERGLHEAEQIAEILQALQEAVQKTE